MIRVKQNDMLFAPDPFSVETNCESCRFRQICGLKDIYKIRSSAIRTILQELGVKDNLVYPACMAYQHYKYTRGGGDYGTERNIS